MTKKAEKIEYRIIDESDKAKVQALWQYCFKDTLKFVELYFKECFKTENTLGAYRGDKLLAAAQLNPYTLILRGQEIAVSYIVGVETAPEERGCGAAGGLMRELLKESAERGRCLTMLMPFAADFYTAYGWQYAYEQLHYIMKLDELRPLGKDYGQIELVDATENCALLSACYQKFCSRFNGVALRDEHHWQVLAQDLANEGGYCALVFQDGQPEGYIFYLFNEEKIIVREFIYANERAKEALFKYLYRHRSQFTEIEFALPADDSSYKLLNNRRAAFIEPCMMVRIADVRKFLTGLKYAVNNISLKIKVNDLLMENNNNIFSLTVTEGAGQINLGADWDVALDIGELSAIILGAEDTEALRRQGKIEVKSEEAFQNLKRLWPKENNYINEEY